MSLGHEFRHKFRLREAPYFALPYQVRFTLPERPVQPDSESRKLMILPYYLKVLMIVK